MKKVNFASVRMSLYAVLVGLYVTSCGSPQTDPSPFPVAKIREAIGKPTALNLGDEIKGVTYVPLEATSDDGSLIDGVYDYAVTGKYIYVLPVKEPRIVLFDRNGRFIKTLIHEGQGPGEFSGMPTCIQADESRNRLYLYNGNQVYEYTLDGDFVRGYTHEYQVLYARHLGEDRLAGVSFPFQPFHDGAFGLGIFTVKGDTIAIKNDFYTPSLPREKCGFTIGIAANYSDMSRSVLFKTGSNDTVFSISADTIEAVCVLDLRNSEAEAIRSLDISDFSNIQDSKKAPEDIFVQDMFDTPNRYYFRLWYNEGSYVASVDKETGKTLVEKCEMPGSLKDLADANLQHGMEGTRSYRDFPIWGRVFGKELVQVVTPYELSLYKSLPAISFPKALDIDEEEGNPIFIFYSLKAPLSAGR